MPLTPRARCGAPRPYAERASYSVAPAHAPPRPPLFAGPAGRGGARSADGSVAAQCDPVAAAAEGCDTMMADSVLPVGG